MYLRTTELGNYSRNEDTTCTELRSFLRVCKSLPWNYVKQYSVLIGPGVHGGNYKVT